MKRGGGLHPARPDWWTPTKRPRATPGGLITASGTYLSRREGVHPCFRTSPPLGGTLGVHRTTWRILFPKHACMFSVLGFRGAWVWHAQPRVPKQRSLRMQPYCRSPDFVWPGHLHGTGCLSARAMDTGFPIFVWRLCLGLGFAVTPPLLGGVLSGCAWVRVFVSFLRCVRLGLGLGLLPAFSGWGLGLCVCVFVCTLGLYPADPGWGVWCGCVCLGSGFCCAPPLLAGILGGCACLLCMRLGLGFGLPPAVPGSGFGVCACVCVRAPPYPATPGWHVRCGWLGVGSGCGCAPPLLAGVLGCVCVFVCALRLYPATPGWNVRCGCVCFGSGFRCAPPLVAGVLGCVCVCVRAPLVPRHSWLGCVVWLWVLGLGCKLRPATPGWGVGCVCVCVCAPLVPRHSWLGCAVWVCVCGLGFWLHPASPGWDFGVGVCLCARFVCTPPLLAGVCGVGVCFWARVPAAPRQSWLVCWGVCVFVCVLRLYPATSSWGVQCWCV